MQAYQFKTNIPKSGIIAIPSKIKKEVLLKEVEVIIKKMDEADLIDRLKGSFAGCLSTSSEFSKRKKEEKRLEL